MVVKNSTTGEGISYANWTVYNGAGQEVVSGEADSKGNVSNGNFSGLSGTVKFTAAGYQENDVDATDAASADFINLLESGNLPAVVFTAIRKVKSNPAILLILVAVVVLTIVYRKKIFSLFK